MGKTLKFIGVTLWIILTRAYDTYATFQFTPDLSREANPLSSVFGLSWSPIILIISILTIYTIYAYYKATFERFALFPDESGFDLSHFIGFSQLGKKAPWTVLLYRLPSSWQRGNHLMGHLLTRCMAFAGVISTLMWLGINYVPAYKAIHSATAIYAIIIIGCVTIIYLWYRAKYVQYKSLEQVS